LIDLLKLDLFEVYLVYGCMVPLTTTLILSF